MLLRIVDVSVSDEEICVGVIEEVDSKLDEVIYEQSLSVHSTCVELMQTAEELVYAGIKWLLMYVTLVAMAERVQT